MAPCEILGVAKCVTNSVKVPLDVRIGIILVILQKFRYLLQPAASVFLLDLARPIYSSFLKEFVEVGTPWRRMVDL